MDDPISYMQVPRGGIPFLVWYGQWNVYNNTYISVNYFPPLSLRKPGI